MNVLMCKWDKTIFELLKEKKQSIILLLDQFDVDTYDIPTEECKMILQIPDYNSLEQIIEVASTLIFKGERIDKIISHTEFSQAGAGLLAELLKIENFSLQTALYSRDKRLMKEVAKSTGWSTAPVITSMDLNHDIDSIHKTFGFPIILKPSNGFGTFSTKKIDNIKEYENELKDLKSNLHPLLRSSQLVAEKYITGDEYNANTVWKNGKITFMSISKNFVPRIEATDIEKLNGCYILEEDDNKEIYAIVTKKLTEYMNSIKFNEGISHCEFFLLEDDIIFSEVATRMGGGGIDLVIRNRYKKSLKEFYIDTICSTQNSDYQKANNEQSTYGYINVTPNQSGTIYNMSTKSEIEQIPYIEECVLLRKVGSKINISSNPSNWCILICFAIPKNKDLTLEVRKITEKIKISAE